MIRCFPHDTAFLERTRLRYVRLENILNDGKVTRSGRLTGLVVLYFGEELGWIFLQDGEPINAARLRAAGREVVPLPQLLQRAQVEEERADIAYYAVTEMQLRAMYSTLGPPAWRPSPDEVGRPGELLGGLHERGFAGVLEVGDATSAHYLVFDEGRLTHAFLAGRTQDEPIDAALERVFFGAARERLYAAGFPLAPQIPVQAPEALTQMYRRLVADSIAELSVGMGQAGAIGCFRESLERLKPRHPELRRFVVRDDGVVGGDVLATADRLTAAMAAWLFDALSTASRMSGVDPLDVFPRVTRPHFFALKAQGFFRHVPWPASI